MAASVEALCIRGTEFVPVTNFFGIQCNTGKPLRHLVHIFEGHSTRANIGRLSFSREFIVVWIA